MANQSPGFEEFLKLVEKYGLSLDNPEDGWRLAATLFKERLRIKKKPGRKADPWSVVDDIILRAGVWHAIKEGYYDPDDASQDSNLLKVIGDIAKWNGWRTDEKFLKRKRDRYRKLQRPSTSEHRNMVALLVSFRPQLKQRLAKLEGLQN
jgi:hypothetical protein